MAKKVSTILDEIEDSRLMLPEFQREFAWTKPKIRDLFLSLYKGYPVGGILLWETDSVHAVHRGDHRPPSGLKTFIVDGQQRLTTLYGVLKGHVPAFYPENGGESAFEDLHFNVMDESLAHFKPGTEENSSWIQLRKLFSNGAIRTSSNLRESPVYETYLERLNDLYEIQRKELHIETIPKKYDLRTVVEIFDKVNSNGTPINRADLTFAVISTKWPAVRSETKSAISKWVSYKWEVHHLLRCMVAKMTGRADYPSLQPDTLTASQLGQGFRETVKHIDVLLDNARSQLGVDYHRVLGSRNSFPIMVFYLSKWGGIRNGQVEVRRLLCWYLHTIIWRHYTGAKDNSLQVDLNVISEAKNWDDSLQGLMRNLHQTRGDLIVKPINFESSQVNSTYFPFLYVLARTGKAMDFDTGENLSKSMNQNMEIHHLFPRKILRGKYPKGEINTLANYAFLTGSTNLRISDSSPEAYFEEIESKCPGALESQWVPMDKMLWKLENYPDFVAARRDRIAIAANDLLSSLEAGRLPEA